MSTLINTSVFPAEQLKAQQFDSSRLSELTRLEIQQFNQWGQGPRQQLTYQQLDDQANVLAAHLQNMGVNHGDVHIPDDVEHRFR